jgi:hypothetical protein
VGILHHFLGEPQKLLTDFRRQRILLAHGWSKNIGKPAKSCAIVNLLIDRPATNLVDTMYAR